jgi:putative transposase
VPRIARVVVPGMPHHVTQRGNFGLTVFDDDEDRLRYLKWLGDYAETHGVRVWAYCLMGNHVHYVVVPEKDDSLAKTFNQVHRRHSLIMNRKHQRRGHLWQDRYHSCVLDDAHLYWAIRYVERNPVRAGLIERPEDYRWSSAPARVLGVQDQLLAADCPLSEAVEDWASYLSEWEDTEDLTNFRENTRTGRPVGSKGFVKRMEERLGRVLDAMPKGRPNIIKW